METDEASSIRPKCFAPLLSRPFWAPIVDNSIALCPSMDLMTLRLKSNNAASSSNSSSTNRNYGGPLWLHRTLDFHQLSVLGPRMITSSSSSSSSSSSATTEDTLNVVEVTAAAWRPDGRWLCVCDTQGMVTLYHVEAMVTHGAALTNYVESSLSALSDKEEDRVNYAVSAAGNLIQFPTNRKGTHHFLCWAHCVAPTSGSSLYERLRKANIPAGGGAAATNILPPSAYHLESNPDLAPSVSHRISVLAIVSEPLTLDCFLQGQYPILTNIKIIQRRHHFNSNPSTSASNKLEQQGQYRVQASLDLAHWWVYTHTTVLPAHVDPSMTLCSIPALGKHRYTLQSMAVLYASIMTHLHKLPSRMTEVSAAYMSSLKPVDRIWEDLRKLLKNYGLEREPIRKLLAQYILVGHATCTDDLCNAMDQFFTSIQMNDQLIQRMDRSMTVAIANVESLLRQVVAATQALFVQTDALLGLAHATTTHGLLPTSCAQNLHQAAQTLVMNAEACVTALVESRFRLRDWIACLRAMGSAVKARGTAPQSAQRENAKKRRMTDATLQRVLQNLSEPAMEDEATASSSSGFIMGLRANAYWDPNRSDLQLPGGSTISTFPYALKQTIDAAIRVFEAPRAYLSERVYQVQVVLPLVRTSSEATSVVVSAVGTRQGPLWNGSDKQTSWQYPSEDASGYFRPNILKNHDHKTNDYRVKQTSQWSILAQGTGNRINLFAIPLVSTVTASPESGEPMWDEFDSDNDEDDDDSNMVSDFGGNRAHLESFYLSTSLVLPDGCQLEDITLFGDDGKSALHLDPNLPVQEREQGLGLLLRRPSPTPQDRIGIQPEETSSASSSTLELWIIHSYDESLWEMHEMFVSDMDGLSVVTLSGALSSKQSPCMVLVAGQETADPSEDMATTHVLLYAKTRILSTTSSSSSSSSSSSGITTARLFVSGSRGIATVVENQTTHARLGIWDLQEDDDEEEEDDGDDDDDDNAEMVDEEGGEGADEE